MILLMKLKLASLKLFSCEYKEALALLDTMPHPPAGYCHICGVSHSSQMPHNPKSERFNAWFLVNYGRKATDFDAAAHCPPQIAIGYASSLIMSGVDDAR